MTSEHHQNRGPGVPSPTALLMLRRVVLPLVRLCFRPTLEGTQHLPKDRPYLLVSNHNAGLGLAEILCFSALWAEAFGAGRPIAGYAHPLGFRVWPVTALHRLFGTIPSTYEAAYHALAEGVPILMFPGGDHETLRPIWQANRVDFGGRKGFLRIAAKSGVPIVPMGIHGSHYTAPMLIRGKWIAWLLLLPRGLGIKRWALTLLGVLGCVGIAALPLGIWPRVGLAYLWLASPLVLLPWIPWTIRFRIGEPIQNERLFQAVGVDDDLENALDGVEKRIQALVTTKSFQMNGSPNDGKEGVD